MTATATLDHRELYRLPWTLPDNAISWLEPTSACNLACDGCYRENVANSHKPLDQVRNEIATFRRLRNSDGISIAGSLLSNPLRVFRRLHLQSIMIIQPVDFLENGAQSMCDGCPDMTLWNGDLVWSCRMEELKQFGCWVRTVPRKKTGADDRS